MSTAKVKQAPRTNAAAQAASAQATAASEEAVKQLEQVVAAGKDTLDHVVKASQDAAGKGYEKAAAMTKDQVAAVAAAQSQAQAQALRGYEDAVHAAKENMDALLKSGTILARGMQDMGKTVLGLTQAGIEDSVAVSKKVMAAKTLRELIDLQTDLARGGFDRWMAESQRLADMASSLTEEALAPITARVSVAVDKLVKPTA